MINNYEVVYIIREEIKEFDSIKKKIEDLLKGKVKSHDFWETKILAYPIKKQTIGHYMILKIETEGKNIKEFNLKIKFVKEIIRCLVINLDNEKKFKITKRYVPKIKTN